MTNAFRRSLDEAGITDLAPIKENMTAHLRAHNEEETPLFAREKASRGKFDHAGTNDGY